MRFLQVIASIVVLACLTGAQVASAGTVTYYHADLLGSPIAATNASGQVIWRENYRPYGERLTIEANSASNKVWFTSRRQDGETGLVYMGARYYDPAVGRFMAVDPIAFQEADVHSFNRYAYANNNPHRFHDPNGMWAEDVALAVPSLIIGALSFRDNLGRGSYTSAAVDGVGMFADVVAAALPGIPGGAGLAIAASRKLSSEVSAVTAGSLKNGDSLPTGKALEAALDHLGTGYSEVAPGVFKSADGARVVRMTDSDLAKVGNHAGGPHINLESGRTVAKPNGKERFIAEENKHIYLPQEK